MASSTRDAPTTLTDLPPELWENITNYLPTASSVANLGRTSKSLNRFVEKDAWKKFSRIRFPSLCPTDSSNYRDVARTLTTLSKAWDKKAFVARYNEPSGSIQSFPSGKIVEKWKKPRGQTIGFMPQIDIHEHVGARWSDRDETLAFCAGAEVCVRQTTISGGHENTNWTTYRPLSAFEGRDDVTTLHLLRPGQDQIQNAPKVITGTANGDLQLVSFPDEKSTEKMVQLSYFTTNGLPVRSSSVLQESDQPSLLAANLGDVQIALYQIDPERSKTCPLSQIDIQPDLGSDGHPSPLHRVWSTTFLSSTTLAAGIGPSNAPIHIYSITESGFQRNPLRKFNLQNDYGPLTSENPLNGVAQKSSSSIYTLTPLPPTSGSRGDGQIFLSGAYDGIIRLHDLRSNRDVEQTYIDPADDGAIYSLLPRGRETLVAGTSRHKLLKVFDLRLGAKCFDYVDLSPESTFPPTNINKNPNKPLSQCDFNIFLHDPHNPGFTARGSGWNRHRSTAESSVYSLASSSPHSPYIYAGVENAVMSLAFTQVLDPHPDPVFFQPWTEGQRGNETFQPKDVLGLAMYEQTANMQLRVQRSLWETWRVHGQGGQGVKRHDQGVLDERWKSAAEFGP